MNVFHATALAAFAVSVKILRPTCFVEFISVIYCQLPEIIQLIGPYKKIMIQSAYPNWRSKYEVQRIDWPSMSSDLNPIENIWKLLKMNLARKNLRTYKSLVSAIKKEWKAFPKNLTINLVRSMKNRISNKGNFIMYR